MFNHFKKFQNLITKSHQAYKNSNRFYTSVRPTEYFKITNANENHHGFQYCDGLNILKEKFNKTGSCVPGGLYFTNAKNILSFLRFGTNLRKVYLPTDNKNFVMVEDPNEDKWRANMLILGEKMSLSDSKTFEYLSKKGANIHANKNILLRWASRNGYLEVVKFMIKCVS